jgi:hypothetical protein
MTRTVSLDRLIGEREHAWWNCLPRAVSSHHQFGQRTKLLVNYTIV